MIASNYDLLGRFRGDATFRGNDFVNVINTDGGFVRSVLMFGVLVFFNVVVAASLNGTYAIIEPFPAFPHHVCKPNAL